MQKNGLITHYGMVKLYPFIMLCKVLGEPVSTRARPFHDIIKFWGGRFNNLKKI
jgi:hypothetical protein